MFYTYALYFHALLRNLIKKEQTVEKSSNFQKTLLNTWTSFSQNFNAVACFVFELLDFVFDIYTIFLCSFSEFNKNGTKNLKNTKLWVICDQYLNNSSFHPLASLFHELLSFISGSININFIIICSFTDFNKNRTNNGKKKKNFKEVIASTCTTNKVSIP